MTSDQQHDRTPHGAVWVRLTIVGLCIMATLGAAYAGYAFAEIAGLSGVLVHVSVGAMSIFVGVMMYLSQYVGGS